MSSKWCTTPISISATRPTAPRASATHRSSSARTSGPRTSAGANSSEKPAYAASDRSGESPRTLRVTPHGSSLTYNGAFPNGTDAMILYALTIFSSAFLLFLVQPIMAKQILPWFGGSAAVWTTCLVFFQFLLLFGYAYADWTTRYVKTRQQAILHIVLLLVSLVSLPIVADASWKPGGQEEPGLRILGLLGATVGLPYFLLSTTGPLIQAWFARNFPAATVYRLFALSNLAS